jgi:ABC-type proline/glycine betaine transport system substrate-binding protein
MTKDTGKVSETDYKFDWLTILKGERHSVTYYSKYGWQSSAGVYKQLTDSSSDLLVADESEYDLFLKKGRYIGLQETNNDENTTERAAKDYDLALKQYGLNNPDESQIMISTYSYQ